MAPGSTTSSPLPPSEEEDRARGRVDENESNQAAAEDNVDGVEEDQPIPREQHPIRTLGELMFASSSSYVPDPSFTYEEMVAQEDVSLTFAPASRRVALGDRFHDRFHGMRLDTDQWSYEQLFALGEQIGHVSTGLKEEEINTRLTRTTFSSATRPGREERELSCSICQTEYEDGEEMGHIECGHGYHTTCIETWLKEKNQCPYCKAKAFEW